jgi:vesicle coat complex subunit
MRFTVTLVSSQPEVQYVALRNILLIVQKRPDLLRQDMKVFFCKYNDPIYVKLSKLEIMFRLADENTVGIMLAELKEYILLLFVDYAPLMHFQICNRS